MTPTGQSILEAELLSALVHTRNVLNAKGGSTEMERVKATLQADVAIAKAGLSRSSVEERITNLVSVIDKQDAEIKRLRGQLDAAEQHVKVLQEQRAFPKRQA